MTPAELLAFYTSHNWRLLFWKRRGDDPKEWKGPHGLDAKGWNDPAKIYPLAEFNPLVHNLGVFTGHELAPEKFLIDIDLDWIHAFLIARKILPATGVGFTRKGKLLSHAMYTTNAWFDIATYCDLADDGSDGNGKTFIEMRGGKSSRQTMIAPSLHTPPDTYITLLEGTTETHLDLTVLQNYSLDTAIGCLLLSRLPGGLHHDARLALAGFLLKANFSGERVIALLEAVVEGQQRLNVVDPPKDIADCTAVVSSTLDRLKDKGKKTYGAPKFAELAGPRGKEIVARIRKWMGVDGSHDLVLTPNEPMQSARIFVDTHYVQHAVPTLYNQGQVFYRYDAPAYGEYEDGAIRADLWKFLETAKTWNGKTNGEAVLSSFSPNTSKVSNVLDALRGVTNLALSYAPPVWLANGATPGSTLNPLDILACSNGLLHIPTRTLIPATPSFFTVNGLKYAYDPSVPAPTRWLAFLADLWENDPESIATLQEMFGYLLTPDTHFQKIFLMVGPKRSGKSLIGRILTKLIGQENTCSPTLSSFSRDFGKQPLVGKSLALIADARISGKADTAIITETLLAISGEDPQTVERKYLPAWSGKLLTRFLIITNELPRIGDVSGALASRFIILILRKSFFGHEDLDLYSAIEPELPGILNWALEGRDRLYQRQHFVQPTSSAESLQALEDLSSPTATFFREVLSTETAPPTAILFTEDFFKLWSLWSTENGMKNPGNSQVFARAVRASFPYVSLRELGTDPKRKAWMGLKLNEEWAARLADETTASQPATDIPLEM